MNWANLVTLTVFFCVFILGLFHLTYQRTHKSIRAAFWLEPLYKIHLECKTQQMTSCWFVLLVALTVWSGHKCTDNIYDDIYSPVLEESFSVFTIWRADIKCLPPQDNARFSDQCLILYTIIWFFFKAQKCELFDLAKASHFPPNKSVTVSLQCCLYFICSSEYDDFKGKTWM